MDTKLSASRALKRALRRILLAGLLLLTAALSCRGWPSSAPRTLHKGDELNGMEITTGSANAHPLDTYCTFEIVETVAASVDCQVPPLTRLAIGHIIDVMDWALQDPNGSKPTWQVYLDGYLLDLDSFAIQSDSGSQWVTVSTLFRKVFKPERTWNWDIVLVHPTSGMHTLFGTAQENSIVYNWVVNFMINSPGAWVLMDRSPQQPPAWHDVWTKEDERMSTVTDRMNQRRNITEDLQSF